MTSVVQLPCNFSPPAFDDRFQAVEISHWLFFPWCELNVNARMCKHDVIYFISFVPVWLFHLSVEALQKKFTAKVRILVQQYLT